MQGKGHCDKGSIAREDMEIIEIGAVMVDTANFAVIDEFSTFVKPVVYPLLTEFCIRLTTITQEAVDIAPVYEEAIRMLKNWAAKHEDYVFCSWGAYDKYQFEVDSRRHQLPYPFSSAHLNLKALFHKSRRLKKRCSVSTALHLTNLKFIGTPHRGIDDARNIARLLPAIATPVARGQLLSQVSR